MKNKDELKNTFEHSLATGAQCYDSITGVFSIASYSLIVFVIDTHRTEYRSPFEASGITKYRILSPFSTPEQRDNNTGFAQIAWQLFRRPQSHNNAETDAATIERKYKR